MSLLTHLDLFSGIGGFALAARWAGFRTIGFVEIDKYCQKVLNKHWPDVPVVEDIRDVETIKEVVANATGKGCLAKQYKVGISSQAIREAPTGESSRASGTYRGEPIAAKAVTEVYSGNRPVTLITGGFPCQPFSVAGKRGGKSDDRYLWPEMLRVISEVRPRWVLGENVAGIVRMELDNVLSDLEREGYSCRSFVVPACAVNAPHRRDRVWIVGYATGDGLNDSQTGKGIESRNQRGTEGENQLCQPEGTSRIWKEDVAISQGRESWQPPESEGGQDSGRGSQEVAIADTEPEGLERGERHSSNREREGIQRKQHNGNSMGGATRCLGRCRSEEPTDWWAVEPELGRVAHGVPARVDRLKCLGNAIVPQVAFQILKGIAEIERLDDKPRR